MRLCIFHIKRPFQSHINISICTLLSCHSVHSLRIEIVYEKNVFVDHWRKCSKIFQHHCSENSMPNTEIVGQTEPNQMPCCTYTHTLDYYYCLCTGAFAAAKETTQHMCESHTVKSGSVYAFVLCTLCGMFGTRTINF